MKQEIDRPTKNLADYIRQKGISVRNLAEKTRLSYSCLSDSLLKSSKGTRSLRANEYLAICEFLDLDPRDFADSKEEAG